MQQLEALIRGRTRTDHVCNCYLVYLQFQIFVCFSPMAQQQFFQLHFHSPINQLHPFCVSHSVWSLDDTTLFFPLL